MKKPGMITNLLILGSFGSFIISTFLATVVFDKVSQNSTLPDQEIELGMAVQATDQHIEVFIDSVMLLQTSVDILDIQKLDENGENPVPGSIVDLFPVGAAAHGKGKVEFRIKSISKDKFPDLRNRTQVTTPMAYIREETLNEFVKSVLKLAAVGIKSAGLMAWMGVLFSLGCIVAGAGLLYLDKAKAAVEDMDE